MKPMVHRTGTENRTRPPYMVNIQLKILTPVGTPMTMLAAIGHEDEIRLACQARINGDCAVETHADVNWSGENFWQKPYPNK